MGRKVAGTAGAWEVIIVCIRSNLSKFSLAKHPPTIKQGTWFLFDVGKEAFDKPLLALRLELYSCSLYDFVFCC